MKFHVAIVAMVSLFLLGVGVDSFAQSEASPEQSKQNLSSEPYIDNDSIMIATGAITGVYYPLGSAICRLVNKNVDNHLQCSVESTTGSIYNIAALRNAEADFAIIQSDWQDHAYKGTNMYSKDAPFENMRTVFSFYVEAMTFLVRNDSNIKTLDDIRGKDVNIGNIGSGVRATLEEVFSQKGWRKSDFRSLYQYSPYEQVEALCRGVIDVMIVATGHPNGLVQEVTRMCEARILNIADPVINKMVNENTEYSFTNIPGGLYFANPFDSKSFGVTATLVTTSDMSDEVVYQVTKEVFDNIAAFKRLHPVFMSFDVDSMVNEGRIAPIHPGAERYFVEKGMMKKKSEASSASPATNPDTGSAS